MRFQKSMINRVCKIFCNFALFSPKMSQLSSQKVLKVFIYTINGFFLIVRGLTTSQVLLAGKPFHVISVIKTPQRIFTSH